MERGDWPAARAAFERGLAAIPPGSDEEANLRCGLTRAYNQSGAHELARAQIPRLRELLDEQPAQLEAESLATALGEVGEAEQALRLAREQVEHFPDSSRLWHIIATTSANTGDVPAAREAIDRAAALLLQRPAGPGDGYLWRQRAVLYSGFDDGIAAESLVRSFAADHDETSARQYQQMLRFPPALLRDAAARLGLTEQEQGMLASLSGDDGADAEMIRVLRSHLRQLVARCREAGAEPILGSYPWDAPYHEAARAVAAELTVAWLPLFEDFARAQLEQPETPLRVHDGHCNDAGYALMAEAFARRIAVLAAAGRH
jgi:tetratricopeptide (TPR) repeat protein